MSKFKYAFLLLMMGLIGTSAAPGLADGLEESATEAFLVRHSSAFESETIAVYPKYLTIEGNDISGKTKEEVKQWMDEYASNMLERHVTLSVVGNDYEYECSNFGLKWDNPDVLDSLDSWLLGRNFVDNYKIQKDLENNPLEISLDFSVDSQKISEIVQTYTDFYTCEPDNAHIAMIEGELAIVGGTVGKTFSETQIAEEFSSLLLTDNGGELIQYDFPYTETEPTYGRDIFNYQISIIGECTTTTLGEEPRRQNIIKSAEGINGRTVYPGEQFSALDWYGEVTLENGYNMAPTYMDGQQKPGVGGGICQTTTTLYDALLWAEMGIAYRSPHSMLVAYVPPSMDAMVDYATRSDFKAYNNSDYPIFFQAFVNGDSLTVRVWGCETRPANRTLNYKHEVISCEFIQPLYWAEPINDEVCKVGAYGQDQKMYEEVAPHPHVVSKLWKEVTVDGVLTERYVVNPEVNYGNGDGYDEYAPMQGVIYHASDCVLTNWLVDDPDAWLGVRVHHDCRFPNGNAWDGNFYDQNMHPEWFPQETQAPEPQPEWVPEPQPEWVPEPQPEPQPEWVPEPQPEPQPEWVPEPQPEWVPEA